jgi:hypothetical protein
MVWDAWSCHDGAGKGCNREAEPDEFNIKIKLSLFNDEYR